MGCSNSRVTAQDNEDEKDMKVWERYERGDVLGKGGYGEVLIVEDKKTREKAAMKLMSKECADNASTFQSEVESMKLLDHKNIVKFINSYEDEENYYLVSELCSGGELFDHIVENQRFSERIASSIVRDILLGIQHCHSRNVVHLDMKPENLVLKNEDPNSDMVIIDFGCARYVEPGKMYRDRVGTPYYVAPEMLDVNLKKDADMLKACDMWSIGVITYVMVTGRPPFGGSDNARIYARIRRGEYKYPNNLRLSEELRDLINNLLCQNPVKRLTVEEALKHPWIQGQKVSEAPIDQSVREALKNFQDHSKLKKAIAHMLVNNLTTKDDAELRKKFQELDSDNSGALDKEEVVKLLVGLGYDNETAKVGAPSLIKDIDTDNDGVISEAEFRTVAMRGQLSIDENRVRSTFAQLDVNHDGVITQEEMSTFLKLNPNISIKQMFDEADTNKDGKITYDEFMRAMLDEATATVAPAKS